ncbi:MAG: hypothetical protein JNL92_24775 [Opitutaceae bacterium]|nr:hypothetical protein [Opitutaceae bacterium]
MVEWILERLGLVIFVVIFLSQVVRGVLRARKAKEEHQAGYDETAEGRRVREIQERIRRQVAERRGLAPDEPPPLSPDVGEPPVARPETTQLPEVFGGPLGRMLEELQKRAQPQAERVPPPVLYTEVRNTAEVERQERIAEELRVLEEQRMLVQRRAAQIAAEKTAETNSSAGVQTAARNRTLGDLRDPQALRRAFVLREVLGPPVGLR